MSESPFLAKRKAEAPANGSTIVASLESLFQQAQTALSGMPNAAALAALATKLPDTAKQAADYV
ncbi:MAG: hypothetical protein J0H43_12210, partial [Actinobacteria bacterium]|nr:hypothetical protein [Actinomycetota bacterium]